MALGFDGLNNPELVGQDPVVAFKTAIWFWMTPQAPKPSCHDVMQGLWTPTAADITAGRVAGFGELSELLWGLATCCLTCEQLAVAGIHCLTPRCPLSPPRLPPAHPQA